MSIMTGRPEKEIFEEIASIKKLGEIAFVEKDWFVTQVINIIGNIRIDGFQIVFSGGTALAKAHGLTSRFSEDIDFRVITEKSLNTRVKRSAFKKAVLEKLRAADCLIRDEQVKARDENRFFAIDMDYETYFEKSDFLRPHIQIEIIFRSPQLLPEKHSVASFFTELSGAAPEVPEILCVQPVENAADKLSALAWRIPDRVRNSYNDDPSIVRHIHDLALLRDKALQSPEFSKMVLHSMQCDNSRPKNDESFANKTPQEKFEAMFTVIEQDQEYPNEYDRFVKMMSYALYENQVPDFKTAMKSVRELAGVVTA
jgi:hypothetical protein